MDSRSPAQMRHVQWDRISYSEEGNPWIYLSNSTTSAQNHGIAHEGKVQVGKVKVLHEIFN